MPYVDDRGGIAFDGDNPWKGYPVAIVERIREIIVEVLANRKAVGLLPTSRFVMDLGIELARRRGVGHRHGASLLHCDSK